jgi:IS605 OrfB family transposase
MKLIAQLQLKPTAQQKAALLATLERANQACDFISELAWEHQVFGQFALHKISYEATRARFDLSAQVVVRCIKKVCDAYALDKKVKRTFKPHGAISYDERILTYKVEAQTVSIWTVEGRNKMPFVCGERQKELLKTRQGESDLALVKGKWFLLATCNVEEPEIDSSRGVIGCDFGIVEIVTTSEGKSYSGEKVKTLRRKLRAHRARLQKCGTHSAKRRLKKAAKRQERFVRNSNHCISKELVKDAKASHKALGLEDLKGIRERSKRLNKEMRWQMGNWAFAQLRGFCEYKAKAAGVAVVCVDAAYTSRTCSACGHCEKGNRKSQKHFKCLACGFEENADFNASLNISERALVNAPIALHLQRIAELGSASLTPRG